MSTHDPFGGDGDRTIIKPMPGGRRPGPAPETPRPAAPPAAAQMGATAGANFEQVALTAVGANPLLACAAPLLSMIPQLRSSVSHADPAGLQAHVAQEIGTFEARARQAGEAPETILVARYVLCTLVDETAMATPWGVESNWGAQTLLVRFHNEARGGEKFFQILERLLQDPGRNQHLLELMYVCLALGFLGKYRLLPRGSTELERVQQQVYEALRTLQGEPPQELSLRWQGVEDQRPRLARYVPLWVLGAIGAVVCLLMYVGLLFTLSGQAEPVLAQMASVGTNVAPLETRVAAEVERTETLSSLLSADPAVAAAAAAGLLKVAESGNEARVQLWELFPSGEAAVSGDRAELVQRIGGALARIPGSVRVVGHTDDQPIRSLRFPSNWVLSERRAESVTELLEEAVPAGRIASEGRAETEPLFPNDSAANRALNRRVEITLFYEAPAL